MLKTKKHIITIGITLVVISAINLISSQLYKRFDLTQDQRYTLSDEAIQTVENVDSPLIIDVFLEGDFPSEFRRLRNETQQLLEEFTVNNSNVKFDFINPLADEATRKHDITV